MGLILSLFTFNFAAVNSAGNVIFPPGYDCKGMVRLWGEVDVAGIENHQF